MNKKIMILAELSKSGVDQSYYELLTKGKEVFGDTGTEFAALAMGSGIGEFIDELADSGVGKIYWTDDERLSVFHPDYSRDTALEAIYDYAPDVLLIGATAMGEELAPSLGMVCNTGVAAHCTDLKLREDGKLAQMVPAFGGKVIGEIFTPNTKPQIATVKPGMFTAQKQEKAECERIHINMPAWNKAKARIEIIGVSEDEVKGVPLEKAEVVICGGYGIGNEDNWKTLTKLANTLGGAVGCTRPVVDFGWTEGEKAMIGTSGKSVSPKVYIGVGIGGATHHVCGIKGAGTIININKDPESESFQISDYKVVCDGREMLDALLEKLQ